MIHPCVSFFSLLCEKQTVLNKCTIFIQKNKWHVLHQAFKIKDIGILKYFLGLEVAHSKQRRYYYVKRNIVLIS